ncbi:ribbon-helix-helix protein, CopG family [Nesterenkonia muleiensis]|uniref:ribbon-helix-helix protein, CopG family n=1 Tax=Nesterenkonia muleiensis TaxID=2282648 RepID=UPI0013001ED2|nr:ribbon-helix-helix protein, CopG family [Nesterenkonia muleiensis]
MATTTIRVDEKVRARIAERSKAQGKPMSQVIEEALEAQADQEFWAEVRRTMTTPQAREDLRNEAEKLSGGYQELLDEDEDWGHLL